MTDRIVEERIGTVTEIPGMIEAGTGLEKGYFPETITTIEIGVKAIIGSGQVLEQVQPEIGSDVISVGNMTIS